MVITPLTGLMYDQKKRFSGCGLRVEFVGIAQEDPSAISAVLHGIIQVVLIFPESILNNVKFGAMFQKEVAISRKNGCPSY